MIHILTVIRSIITKIQVSVAEEEVEENQDTEENSNNREQTLHEEDYDDGYSNRRSDDDSDENLVYVVNDNEDEFRSIISVDEGVPAYLKEFKSFQLEAFKKAKAVGLFVNADLYQIL